MKLLGGIGRLCQVLCCGAAIIVIASTPGQAHGRQTCEEREWLPGHGLPGFESYQVYASTAWDPDGTGPLKARLLVGGAFNYVGAMPLPYIAQWDTESHVWSMVGDGLDGGVHALITLSNGEVVAGGYFGALGSTPMSRIARWDGSEWSPIGTGCDGGVKALCEAPNGDLYAGGVFQHAGDTLALGIARWDGRAWSGMQTGVFGQVNAITALSNGEIIVGGAFANTGTKPASNIARWDGQNWWPLGQGVSGTVHALTTDAKGEVLIGGWFGNAGGVTTSYLARWSPLNGGTWSGFGTMISGGPIYGFETAPGGNEHVITGSFKTIKGVPFNGIARWNGLPNGWQTLGSGVFGPSGFDDTVYTATVLADDAIFAGGSFFEAGGRPALDGALWNGEHWSAVVPGIGASVVALTIHPDGYLIAGADMVLPNLEATNHIAMQDKLSGEWMRMGEGLSGTVRAIEVTPSGEVIAASDLGVGNDAQVTRWNGSEWMQIGPALDYLVYAMALLPDEYVAIGGQGGLDLLRGSGGPWSVIGKPDAAVNALAAMNDGDLVAGGYFATINGKSTKLIGRWNGSTWSSLGPGLSGTAVHALKVLADGDLVATGSFGSAQLAYIARWSDSDEQWHSLGSGLSFSGRGLYATANQELLVVGDFDFAGGLPASRLARWNATANAWSALSPVAFNNSVWTVVQASNGDIVVGGNFTTIGRMHSVYLATLGCEDQRCLADCDASGSLNIDDFVCFQTIYAIGVPEADCDGSRSLDIDDFVCFQTMFAIGC